MFQSSATPHCQNTGPGRQVGINRQSPRNLLLSLQHRVKQWWGDTENVCGLFGCSADCHRLSQTSPEHSPGVWHSAEGTPRKGGLKWGPRAMWGAFWGDSRGGGWDISLQESENKATLKTCRAPGPGSGRTSWLQMSCILPQRLLSASQPHAELLKWRRKTKRGRKAARTPQVSHISHLCLCGLSARLSKGIFPAHGRLKKRAQDAPPAPPLSQLSFCLSCLTPEKEFSVWGVGSGFGKV